MKRVCGIYLQFEEVFLSAYDSEGRVHAQVVKAPPALPEAQLQYEVVWQADTTASYSAVPIARLHHGDISWKVTIALPCASIHTVHSHLPQTWPLTMNSK